ncbi:MAG: ATP-binding protein [Treponema sp.]|jgi:hypothetical protein|nr:ATP-binding protein [Treponema sp.]
MEKFEQSTIWKKTLGVQPETDLYKEDREKLRAAFKDFREKAKLLAAEIALIFPEYTLHDITHIDALWEIAELVIPTHVELTPAEAFVLGGAFLIHDLGMGLAAFPDGMERIKKEEIWKDTVASLFKEKYNRHIDEKDYSKLDNDIEKPAIEKVLRLLHAKNAEKLAFTSWKDKSGEELCLFENYELKESFGRIIGLIAHSHGIPVSELEIKLPSKLGAAGNLPPGWTIDPVMLACILRTADAIHIDGRRTPSLLRQTRKISGLSELHWNFQQKLNQPMLDENDRLIFTSKSPFLINEVDSWWLCYDTLQMVDKEIKAVNALLADRKRQMLKATGVAFIDDAKRLSESIAVEGWEPIDAILKVTNVSRLVENLGGKQLYGNNMQIPLRELIQNSADAIRARRILEDEKPEYGSIIIRIGGDESGQFIEVEDNGIGMSPRVLTGPFLDFGESFWGTSLMHEELPGLEAKGFNPTGQYGIGFFSVFMWGKNVNVFSRRYEKGRDSTYVMEFNHGVLSRPILRKAGNNELIKDGGTKVRVWLSNSEILDTLLEKFDGEKRSKITISELIESICPSIDCNIILEEKGAAPITIIEANDWITMPPLSLIRRIIGDFDYNKADKKTRQYLTKISKNITLLEEDGEIVGRLALYGQDDFSKGNIIIHDRGVVTIGGMRSSELFQLLGILVGRSVRASRDSGFPVVSLAKLKEWATNQADLLSKANLDPVSEAYCASIIRALEGNTSSLKIAYHKSGLLNYQELIAIIQNTKHDSFSIVQDAAIFVYERDNNCKIDFFDNVIWVDMGIPGILQHNFRWPDNEWPAFGNSDNDFFLLRSLQGLVVEAFSETWKLNSKTIWAAMKEKGYMVPVGKVDGRDAKIDGVYIIRRPKKKKASS